MERSVNVIIIPDQNTQCKARELGQQLADNFENYYTLADTTCIPHATIYQAQYPAKNFEKIKTAIIAASKSCKPFEVFIGPYLNHHGYIWWNILQNKNLTELHMQVLKKLNPLREGLLLPSLTLTAYTTGEKFTKEEAENVKNYGAVVIDKLFQPHVTLAKLKDNDATEAELYEILGKVECKFKVSEIAIGELGDYGTVVKILEKFPMKNSRK